MTLLFSLLGRAGPLVTTLAAVLGLLFYVSTLNDRLETAREMARDAEARAAGALEAAELMQRQAAALESSRTVLREELRSEEARIRAASGECLAVALPPGLLD
jgi:hypothetical protein